MNCHPVTTFLLLFILTKKKKKIRFVCHYFFSVYNHQNCTPKFEHHQLLCPQHTILDTDVIPQATDIT